MHVHVMLCQSEEEIHHHQQYYWTPRSVHQNPVYISSSVHVVISLFYIIVTRSAQCGYHTVAVAVVLNIIAEHCC